MGFSSAHRFAKAQQSPYNKIPASAPLSFIDSKI